MGENVSGAMAADQGTPERKRKKKKVCEYKGATYFVMTDMEGKNFIEVEGIRKYLDRNGNVAHKQKGSRCVKTALESFEDAKKVQDYFIKNNQWMFYLLYTLNFNTGRRIDDILKAKWCDFFDGRRCLRKYWNVEEKKTKKQAEIYLNEAVKRAFQEYFKHEPIHFPDDYEEPIFKQRHGTHKGHVLTQEGYRQALIKASDDVLDYEIRSHSMRRGMGAMMLELHPNDPKAKSVLMEIYNHSTEKMTNKYIGETEKLKQDYLKDLGEKYRMYVQDGEEMPFAVKKPVSVYDNAELRNYMMCAFGEILDNSNETDPVKLLELYNKLLDGLESIAQ